MENFKSFLNRYLWLIIILGLIALAIAVYNIGGAYQEEKFNRAVNQRIEQANTAVKQAVNAQNAAVNADIERRAEDSVREKTINPRLDDSRQREQTSKAELDQAKRRYENEKLYPQNLDSSHADNCRKLAELFPNAAFDDCR